MTETRHLVPIAGIPTRQQRFFQSRRSSARAAATAWSRLTPVPQPEPGVDPVPRPSSAAGSFARAWNQHFKPSRRLLSAEEILIWVYTKQRAIEISGRALYESESERGENYWDAPAYRTSPDGCAAIERASILGRAVDGGPPLRGIAQPLHPDAELVHEIVLGLPWHVRAILVRYGRSGIAPEPPPPAKLHRVLELNGSRWRPKIRRNYDPVLKCKLSWCVLVVNPDENDATMLAALHQAWLKALEALRNALANVELRSIELKN